MELSGRLNACATLYYLLGNILRCTVKCARSKNTDYRKPPHLRPYWSQGSSVNQAVVCWSLVSCKNTVINCSSIPMNTFRERKIKWNATGLPLFSVWNLMARKLSMQMTRLSYVYLGIFVVRIMLDGRWRRRRTFLNGGWLRLLQIRIQLHCIWIEDHLFILWEFFL